ERWQPWPISASKPERGSRLPMRSGVAARARVTPPPAARMAPVAAAPRPKSRRLRWCFIDFLPRMPRLSIAGLALRFTISYPDDGANRDEARRGGEHVAFAARPFRLRRRLPGTCL